MRLPVFVRFDSVVRAKPKSIAGDDVLCLPEAQALLLHQLREGASLDELHDDVREAEVFPHIVDCDDVGVRELTGGLGLAVETLTQIVDLPCVEPGIGPDCLERGLPVDDRVTHQIHVAHAPPAKPPFDLVA
jgi:hypothetical protein